MSAPVISIDQTTGYLELVFGPMFSGKTSTLLAKLTVFSELGVPTLYVNHELDQRGEVFSTHNPTLKPVDLGDIQAVKIGPPETLLQICDPYLVIGIDEAQFFGNLKEVVLELVEKKGKRVIVAGLSSNFKREPFGEIFSLIPYADEVTKLKSLCGLCVKSKKLKDAHFSYRVTHHTDEVLVGAAQSYIPLCRECYLNQVNQK